MGSEGMRTGRGCIAHMDEALRSSEAKRAEAKERARRRKYAGRLTPEERKRIAGEGAGLGNYLAFRREYKPTFTEGDWLKVGPNHHIQIASVDFRGQGYRCTIDAVRDFRNEGTPIKTRRRNEDGEVEGEPPGVNAGVLKQFAREAAVKTSDEVLLREGERAAKQALREAMRDLTPIGRMALLGQIQRLIEQSREDVADAA